MRLADDEPLLVRHHNVSISVDEQYELLKEQLAIAQTIKNPGMYIRPGLDCIYALFYTATRHSKEKNLRREISQLRRQMKQQSKKQIEEGMVVVLVLTFIFIVTESSPVKSPRSPHSLPNRGGLANHVLQGSLRLTASRHHILANSGMEIDLNKRRELNQGLPQNFHSQDDDAFDDNNMLLKQSVSPRRRARRPTEKGINMANRKRAASDAQSETVSQKKQKGILKSTEKKILKRAKKIKLKKNKRATRSSNRRTALLIENKQETLKETEIVQSPISLKSPVSIKSPTTSSEEGTSRRLRGRPPKNVLVELEPQPSPADNHMSSEEVETTAVPSGASETDLTARTALPRTRGEKRQRSLSLSAVAKPKRKRKPQMEQWDRQLFGRRRRTQSLSTDVDKKTGIVDTELLTKGSHDLRNKTTQLHSTSNGIVSVRPSLSDFKQLDEHNPLADKVLTECLTNGTGSLKGATKVNKKNSIEYDYIPQLFDVVWAKCKGFKPYPALVRLLLIFIVLKVYLIRLWTQIFLRRGSNWVTLSYLHHLLKF